VTCGVVDFDGDGIFSTHVAGGHGEDVRLPSASMLPCACGRQLQISGFPDCVNFMMAHGGGEAGPGGHDRHNEPGAVV
jgi:hypothetical protein